MHAFQSSSETGPGSEKGNDSRIIQALKERDPNGLTGAYDRYRAIAYSIILRITRNTGAAEDLVQEVFMRVWNRIGDFDDARGSLNSWILTIARNIAIDYIRSSHSRFDAKTLPLDKTDFAAVSYKPNEIADKLDNSKAVRQAFATLNLQQRKVLEMAYFEGFSQSEIALRLEEPLGTVKSWMRAALSRLRTAMQEGGSK
jgi:RNA polymerase sigma-70 factor (ECF subfamily)